MELQKFYIDGWDGSFLGINQGRWNGWYCPKFSKDEAFKLMELINSYGQSFMAYDAKNDCFIFYDHADDETQVFHSIDDEGNAGFYSIGAWCWCWNIEED